MPEVEGSDLQAEAGRSLGKRLTERAKVIPAGVRAAVGRLTKEAQQRRLLREQEQLRQAEARILVAQIDQLFPEESKIYIQKLYTKEEFKQRRGQLGEFHERAKATASLKLSENEWIALSENKPSYVGLKGDRNLTLERRYVGKDGIKAKDKASFTLLPDGSVQIGSGRRQRETGREQLTKYNHVFKTQEIIPGAFRPAFEGESFNDSVAVLELGKEIVGAAKARSASVEQAQVTSVK